MLVELIENKCPCLVSLVRTFIYSTPFSVRIENLIDPQRDKGLDILLLLLRAAAAAAATSWRRENLIDTFEKAEKKEPTTHCHESGSQTFFPLFKRSTRIILAAAEKRCCAGAAHCFQRVVQQPLEGKI